MSRLTDKYGTTPLDNVDSLLKENKNDMFVWGGKAIAKLKEFEDFMEDLGIEDLEELKDAMQELPETNNHIKEVSDKYYISYKEKFNRVLELAEECQTLKDRWEKLKRFIQKDHDWNLEQDNNDCALAERWVLEEMQKLEEEN